MVGFRKINKINSVKVKGFTSRLSAFGVKKGAKTDQSKASADTPDTSPEVTPEQQAEPLPGPESAAAGPTAGGTEADEVLSGILKDLSIDPDIAIQQNKTDDVSEYSGGSAKSVDSETSEEGEKEISIGEKVNMVIAAAEEIRMKKSSSPPQVEGTPLATASSVDTPATEAGDKTKETEPKNTKKPKKRVSLRSKKSKSPTPSKEVETNSETPQHLSAVKHAGETGEESGARAEFSTDFEGQDFQGQDDKAVETSNEDQTFEDEPTKEGSMTDDTTFSEDNTFASGPGSIDIEPSSSNKGSVMNKDIFIHEAGGPNNLVVRAMYYTPLPSTPEEVIIKVEASTVSFRDCMLRRGLGVEKVSFPFTPGCEVVGTISHLGNRAKRMGYRIGDRVVAMNRSGGGNGYYAKFHMDCVSPIISNKIEAADAVCLVDVYMTAYQALRCGKNDGTPLTEANILVTDGYSPVGQAAVQLALLEGANVYVTTSETGQEEHMRSLGAKCLPYSPNKWLHKIKGKMDLVIDNTCLDSYDSSWNALSATGTLVVTGITSLYNFTDYGDVGFGCDAFGDFRDYQARWATMKAKYIMSQTKFNDVYESFKKDPKQYSQELKYLCFLVENGTLKPKIAERVSIEEIPDAQRYLETGKVNGTIVCLP